MRKSIQKVCVFSTVLLGGILLSNSKVEAANKVAGLIDKPKVLEKNLNTLIQTNNLVKDTNKIVSLDNTFKLDISKPEELYKELFEKVQPYILMGEDAKSVPIELPKLEQNKPNVDIGVDTISYTVGNYKYTFTKLDLPSKKLQSVNVVVEYTPVILQEVDVNKKSTFTMIKDQQVYKVGVFLVDRTPPKINLKANKVNVYKDSDYTLDLFVEKAMSNAGELLEVTVENKDSVSTSTLGEKEVILKVQDNFGNITKEKVTLNVIEKPVVRSYNYSNYGDYSYIETGGNFAPINPNHVASINGAVPGNCTWYVYNRLSQLGAPIPYRMMGNGGEWDIYARRYGYSVNRQARAGKAVVFKNGYYGHVAFVERVNADGSVLISEMNRNGLFRISTRTLSAAQASYLNYIDFGL